MLNEGFRPALTTENIELVLEARLFKKKLDGKKALEETYEKRSGVLRGLADVGEDQHAGVPLAEIATRLELQLLATMEGHPDPTRSPFFAAWEHDRSDQSERDGVVDSF